MGTGAGPEDVKFGRKLETWRISQKLTPEDLAGLAGVHVRLISKWERGESKCRKPHLTRVLDLMTESPECKPAPIGPAAGLVFEREEVQRFKLKLDEGALARLLGLPAGDTVKLSIFGCDGKRTGLPLAIEAEVTKREHTLEDGTTVHPAPAPAPPASKVSE